MERIDYQYNEEQFISGENLTDEAHKLLTHLRRTKEAYKKEVSEIEKELREENMGLR